MSQFVKNPLYQNIWKTVCELEYGDSFSSKFNKQTDKLFKQLLRGIKNIVFPEEANRRGVTTNALIGILVRSNIHTFGAATSPLLWNLFFHFKGFESFFRKQSYQTKFST